MKALHTCQVCGFLSTRGAEFTRRNGLTLDKDCAARLDAGDESICKWFAEAAARHYGDAAGSAERNTKDRIS